MQACKICIRSLGIVYDGIIEDGRVYLIDPDGNRSNLSGNEDFYEILRYDENNGRVSIFSDEKWGFAYNDTGKIAVEPIWDYASDYKDGIAVVNLGCQPEEDKITSYRQPTGGKMGCIDLYGDMVVPLIYDGMWVYKGVIIVLKDGLMGVVDQFNEEILPMVYARIIAIGEHAYICKETKGGYLFLYRDEIVFYGAEALYCYDSDRARGKKRIYFIAEKDETYALACDDGRMLSDFNLSFWDAQALAKNLLGGHVSFLRWLQ